MTDHGARDHATWAASSTARNVHCPGALALARFAPPDKESVHAARGTACHQIAEKCLRTGADASAFLDTVEQTKSHAITIDEELVSTAQEYVDYCRRGIDAYFAATGDDPKFWVEEKFKLDDLSPPFDAGGTGDFVFYDHYGKALEIVDLKAGMGVVDAKENPQLRTYALGALLHHSVLDVETVTVTIVQPRAPHKDGRIRSETFHVADLMEWTAALLAAMHRSKQAMAEYDAAAGNSVRLDEWAEKWLNPGKCVFCPAEATCPKLRRAALDVAKVWFEPDTGAPQIGNKPSDMSPEALAETLDMLDMLEGWIKAVRAYAHAQAEAGVAIPGYQLSEKIGNRKWSVEEALLSKLLSGDPIAWLEYLAATTELEGPALQDAVLAQSAKYAIPSDDLYEAPKLKSPAQIDKLLGAKRKALIEPFVERPVTGTNLVSASRTSRPPAKPKAEAYFEPVT